MTRGSLSISCATTRFFLLLILMVYKNLNLTLRAVEDIEEGQELTINYGASQNDQLDLLNFYVLVKKKKKYQKLNM